MESIGEILKKRRTDKELTLADAREGTKITSQNLAALEEDRFDAFPNKVYARAFLRDYSNFLGLDSSSLLQRYEQDWGQPVVVAPEPRKKPWVLGVAVGVVILGGAGFGAYELNIGGVKEFGQALISVKPADPKPETPEATKPAVQPTENTEPAPQPGVVSNKPVPAPDESAVVPEKPASEEVEPADVPTKPAPEKPAVKEDASAIPPGTVVVEVSVTQDSWVEVKRNGKSEMIGTLKAGQNAKFSGKEIYVKTGNAGGLDITVNNKHMGKFGASGQIVKKTFTPE